MERAYRQKTTRFILLATLSAIVLCVGYSSQTVEHLYSDRLYLFTSIVQRFISSLLPFALGDFLYLLLIIYILKSIIDFAKRLFRKSLKLPDRVNIPLQVINFSLILYLTFKILWGLNYSRPPIAKQLGIENEKYNTEQLVSLGQFFISKLNNLQNVKRTKFSVDQLSKIASSSYADLEKENPIFEYHIASVKPVLNSWVITKIGIEGYYNPLSGEANINMRLPDVALPFVSCHEIAHQLGIGREDEANLIGYLAAINSTNQYFQYSAAYAMLKSILFEIRIKSPEDYDKLYATINKTTIRDFEVDRDFWRKYNNEMFGYLDIAFDRFLKLNNQSKGTDSYQDIVLWLYNIHKKDL
ncbi:MAG: DUF3810 domain-containing protein [Pedobacter sp.]|nr:MAG: DUF3810 domain-containing protein [Pedobacter sp.]